MVVERGHRVSERDDYDRPADLLVEVGERVAGGTRELAIGPGNGEQAEEADRVSLRPAPRKAERRLRDEQHVKEEVHRLRRNLDPAALERADVVRGNEPPENAGDDDR